MSASYTSEQKKAGVDRFKKHGVKMLIDALAGGDILKWEEVMKMQYKTVYDKLLIFKDESEFLKDYNAVIFPPNPRKK